MNKLPATSRLKNNSDFRAVIDRRIRLSDGLLTVNMAPNGRPTSRLGVSVGRSSGPAVTRNRLKRLIREAWRQRQVDILPGYDYVVMMANRTRTTLPTYEEIENSLVGLMRKFRDRLEK